MSNPIKYSTGTESLALKKGNFYIGNGAVGKGPTSETGYYNGITPPTGGYTIYLNKESGGPSIYTASNDAQLISLTNSIAGQSYTGVNQCFNYYYSQNDKVLVNQDYPADYPYIVMDGLVLNLDAGITQSYPGSGTTWTDVNGLGPKNNGTLTNGPTFNSDNGGNIVFDGTNDWVSIPNNIGYWGTQNTTFEIWVKPKSSGSLYGLQYLGKGSSCVRAEFGLEYGRQGLGGNEKFSILIHGENFYYLQTTNTYSPNNWYHHVATRYYNGTNYEVKIYINSVLDATGNTTITSDTDGNINIGGGVAVCGAVGTANVDIGCGRIYNRALTATEVLQNFNAQKGRFGL
jgi:hypothetical protein